MRLTLTNVPKSLLVKLSDRAVAHKRTIEEEVLVCLEEMLHESEAIPSNVWEGRFQKMRNAVKVPHLSDDFLDWSVSNGRA